MLTPSVYVVFFYIVWQILTRSDDNEILSHLPSSSPLLSQHGGGGYDRGSSAPSAAQQPYLPYALPQLPPVPSTKSDSTSMWRVVIGTIVYPIYLAVTLLAIPLPFLMNAVNLLLSVVQTILYPVTSTARLLARTFILAPLGVLFGFLQALYPVYVFVGGVVGVGAFLGVAAGYVGRLAMWYLLGRRTPAAQPVKRRRSARRSKRHSLPPAPESAPNFDHHHRSSSFERQERLHVPRSPTFEYERRYVPIVDYVQIGDQVLAIDQGVGTAREGVVLGVRRRSILR